jgi:predicted phosphate transport protein (TIGR00153 family)
VAADAELQQYGVLPYYVDQEGTLRILLITSRDTGRWVIPRGNPMPGLPPRQAAAQEAFEEAGLTGLVGEQEIGAYRYEKRRKKNPPVMADVRIFPLQITVQSRHWPERHQRETRWFTREAAAEAVYEPELKELLLRFEPPPEAASRAPLPLLSPRHPPPPRSSMLKLFRAVMPKEDGFFDMFIRHADAIVGGADAMRAMFAGEAGIEESCRLISEYEHQADDVAREVLLAVRRSFITPFDRSAITDLIGSMDDSIDEMKQTAKAITLYEVESFEPQMREMSALASQAARLVVEAVPLLRAVGRNGARLDRITENIVHLEGAADDLHAEGLKALFKTHGETKPMAYFVGREVYSHLERVLDGFEDVANEIQGIVIDHA